MSSKSLKKSGGNNIKKKKSSKKLKKNDGKKSGGKEKLGWKKKSGSKKNCHQKVWKKVGVKILKKNHQKNLGVSACTYPSLSDFKATFWIPSSLPPFLPSRWSLRGKGGRRLLYWRYLCSSAPRFIGWLFGWLVDWLVG